MGIRIGTIARIVGTKGFGFIRDDVSGLEYFFHRDDLAPHIEFSILKESEKVRFEDDMTAKGRRARRIEYQ